jgi:hypothetical protein
MALTATANEECKQDIVSRLHIESCVMLTSSFNRSNLYYEVKVREKGFMQDVANKIRSCRGGSGVIYCLSRKKCEDTAKELRDRYGIDADHYHADMPKEERQHVQEEWHHGRIQVIVATVSDFVRRSHSELSLTHRSRSVWELTRPMVCSLLHGRHYEPNAIACSSLRLSSSHSEVPRRVCKLHSLLLSGLACLRYYQETGRAGRDGEPANCIMCTCDASSPLIT